MNNPIQNLAAETSISPFTTLDDFEFLVDFPSDSVSVGSDVETLTYFSNEIDALVQINQESNHLNHLKGILLGGLQRDKLNFWNPLLSLGEFTANTAHHATYHSIPILMVNQVRLERNSNYHGLLSSEKSVHALMYDRSVKALRHAAPNSVSVFVSSVFMDGCSDAQTLTIANTLHGNLEPFLFSELIPNVEEFTISDAFVSPSTNPKSLDHTNHLTLDSGFQEKPSWFIAMLRGREELIPKGELGKAFLAIRQAAVEGDFYKIDFWLSNATPSRMRLESMIALLRYPYAYRRELKEWSGFLERAGQELIQRGKNPAMAFPGLDAD